MFGTRSKKNVLLIRTLQILLAVNAVLSCEGFGTDEAAFDLRQSILPSKWSTVNNTRPVTVSERSESVGNGLNEAVNAKYRRSLENKTVSYNRDDRLLGSPRDSKKTQMKKLEKAKKPSTSKAVYVIIAVVCLIVVGLVAALIISVVHKYFTGEDGQVYFDAAQFQHKGPLQIVNPADKFKLEDDATAPNEAQNVRNDAHFVFTESANEVYDIGADVEQIKS